MLDISQNEHKGIGSDKVKTTNINVLLNRVKLTKKTELKKRIIFLFLPILAVTVVSVLSLI